MENSCENCHHCEISLDEDSGLSPAGMMMITYYECGNKKSPHHKLKMVVIRHMVTFKTLDGRERQTCDNHESFSEFLKREL